MDETEVKNMYTLCAYAKVLKFQQLNFMSIVKLGG